MYINSEITYTYMYVHVHVCTYIHTYMYVVPYTYLHLFLARNLLPIRYMCTYSVYIIHVIVQCTYLFIYTLYYIHTNICTDIFECVSTRCSRGDMYIIVRIPGTQAKPTVPSTINSKY